MFLIKAFGFISLLVLLASCGDGTGSISGDGCSGQFEYALSDAHDIVSRGIYHLEGGELLLKMDIANDHDIVIAGYDANISIYDDQLRLIIVDFSFSEINASSFFAESRLILFLLLLQIAQSKTG